MKDFIATLQDPKWVAKFQQMFGIEIIKQLENNKDHKWLPIEVTENTGGGGWARDKGKYNIIFYKVNIMNKYNISWYLFRFSRFTTDFGISSSNSAPFSEVKFSMLSSSVS